MSQINPYHFKLPFQPTCDATIPNTTAINKRILELDSLLQSTKYSKQKDSLKHELISFLSTLPHTKDLHSASPSDIRMFLVVKDTKGKTQVHQTTCTHVGQSGKFTCGCPFRRSAGSMDSLIGQIRAIFRDFGRGTSWNETIGLGNPAAAPIIKKHLQAVRLEQSLVAVTPQKAVPLFLDKLTIVLRHISYCLCNPKLTKHQRYIFHRDRAFLIVLPYTGDRAGDLGHLLTSQVKWLPNEEGLHLSLHTGKTIDIREPRVMILQKSSGAEFCPVMTLIEYLNYCKVNDINLKSGYCFRTLNSFKNQIKHNPFTSSSVNSRLKSYLKTLHIWNGETPHGTRSACAVTLSWLGIDDKTIKSHVGWKSDKMLQHYTNVNTLTSTQTSSSILSATNIKATLKQKIDQYRHLTSLSPVN